MFEQNIAALEKRNPELAAKIKNHGAAKDVEVFQSESGNFIIAYKGVLLHSNEDPLRETKAIWHKTVTNNLQNNDIQVVYGLGLGYLFKRAYVSANSRVIVYEPYLDILRFVFENVALAAEISDERVHFANTNDEVIHFFDEKYLPGDKLEVLFLPSYLNLPGQDLLEFSNRIYKKLKDVNIDQNTAFLNSKQTVENFISRIDVLDNFKPVDVLEGSAEGKTALVLAAGPSLNQDIELIKANKDKFITIAILPIIPYLLENGIEPDFVTVVDSSKQLFKIEAYKDQLSNINMVMESRADVDMNSLQTKSKFLYFSLVDKLSEQVIASLADTKFAERPAVASVSILAYELAKILGCKKVVFAGLDLAFIDDRIYAHSYVRPVSAGNDLMTLECEKGLFSVRTISVKSADGNEVTTREDYLLFIREFAKLAEQRPDIELINTSLKGAYVEGMTYAPFVEVLEGVKESAEFDIDSVLKKSKKISLAGFKAKAKEIFAVQKNELELYKPKIETALDVLKKLIAELNLPAPDLDKFQDLFNKNIPVFSDIREYLTKSSLLSTYLQAEIAEFIATYLKDGQTSIQKIKKNLDTEEKLNKATLAAVENISALLKKI